MFQDLAAETDWDISGDLVWGYHFTNPHREALETLSQELTGQGYSQVDLSQNTDGNAQWQLHVERVEANNPDSLVNNGAQMESLATKYLIHSFSEVTVRPAMEVTRESSYQQAWWTYLADYAGKPGAVSLNLALKEGAPYLDFPSIVITGIDYDPSNTDDGQPNETDLEMIHNLRAERITQLKLHTYAIEAGALILDGEETHYIYVNDTTGVEELLREFYIEKFPNQKFRINIKGNIGWDDYMRSLFPNSGTINYYEDELKGLEMWDWVEDSR